MEIKAAIIFSFMIGKGIDLWELDYADKDVTEFSGTLV